MKGYLSAWAISETIFNSPSSIAKIKQLEQWIAQTNYCDTLTVTHQTVQEFEQLESNLQQFAQWQATLEDIKAALELLELETDAEIRQEAETKITQLSRELEEFELRLLMCDRFDIKGAFLIFNAEGDDTDAQDWAGMLLRMYARWAEKQGYRINLINETCGEYGGWKFATVEVDGRYAYGYLKGETGTHQLERISPFDANSKQLKSFVRVEVIPILDDSVDLEIPEKDLEIITYRWNEGNVNRIDTSVRIVHIPTGVTVSSTELRSQRQNKEKALALLKSKLLAIALSQNVETIAEIRREEIDAIANKTIRHYIFHPYQKAKDLRTGVETDAIAEVMNGQIDLFLKAYMRHQNQQTIRTS